MSLVNIDANSLKTHIHNQIRPCMKEMIAGASKEFPVNTPFPGFEQVEE